MFPCFQGIAICLCSQRWVTSAFFYGLVRKQWPELTLKAVPGLCGKHTFMDVEGGLMGGGGGWGRAQGHPLPTCSAETGLERL